MDAQPTDDFVLAEDRLIDVSSGESTKIQNKDGCRLLRLKENWSQETHTEKAGNVLLMNQCEGSSLSLINGAGHELWRSESLPDQHGRMIRGFKSDNEVVLQMEDLSLHYIANGRMMWHLEEGLSQIKQVEVFDKSTVEEMDNGLPSYVG